ncbi:MAG: helix-turn-helix domain-containing protein [Actinomycetota bacterium]|nr:helix-turn-helix domain-containing protein [Actinomycetota bacterium]
MSRQAIAAVIARSDLASGERLVALSLASFADRENRAWPGAPAASARAGLRRSRYQEAREELVRRGLVAVDERATGRGRASTISLIFADTGPWWDGEINVELFEAVLAYSAASGSARLLLATMAAIAGSDGTVEDVSTEQLCAAAGMTDRTYRRARQVLLASGETGS